MYAADLQHTLCRTVFLEAAALSYNVPYRIHAHIVPHRCAAGRPPSRPMRPRAIPATGLDRIRPDCDSGERERKERKGGRERRAIPTIGRNHTESCTRIATRMRVGTGRRGDDGESAGLPEGRRLGSRGGASRGGGAGFTGRGRRRHAGKERKRERKREREEPSRGGLYLIANQAQLAALVTESQFVGAGAVSAGLSAPNDVVWGHGERPAPSRRGARRHAGGLCAAYQ